MAVLVMSDDEATLKAAIKAHGAGNVWWYASMTNRRVAANYGIAFDRIIAKQTCSPAAAKKASEWDEVITDAEPVKAAPKKGKGKGEKNGASSNK